MTLKLTTSRVAIALGTTVCLVTTAALPAAGAGLVSQATAQGLNVHNLLGILSVALSPTPTSATNDGTGSNAEIDAAPALSLLSGETLLQVGAVKEAAEANQNGTSYSCAGVASPAALIQVGTPATSCSITNTGTGGVVLDLGQLPGLGSLITTGGGDIKITIDAVTAHAEDSGSTAPTLANIGGNVAGVTAQFGTSPVVVVGTNNGVNTDLLGEVLGSLFPGSGPGTVSPLGTAISNLLSPLITLTTNYQALNASGEPLANAAGTYSATGLHVALLSGDLGTVDLAKVTVGPNVPTAPSDAVSFQNLPFILTGLALLVMLGYGVRIGARRVRGLL